MRKIAFDLGDVRIGIATSDIMGIIAGGEETYRREKDNVDKDIDYLIKYAKYKCCDGIVIGLPLNMDGSIGPRAEMAKEWGKIIEERSGVKVYYQDERLTTVVAEKVLISGNVRRENRKKVVDKLAATLILQAFLDSHRF